MTARLRPLDFLIIAVLLLGTFALYFQTRSFEFLGYDDAMYVSGNWYIRSGWSWANLHWVLTDTTSGNWHPLTYLTYLFLSGLFGPKAAVFHLTNALLHSINVSLLYVFLRKTTLRTWTSAIVAVFWGWHPQRAESVAWISELKDLLCGFFWLNCMLAYARYSAKRTSGRYAAVALLLVLALLSKPMAVTLPAILLLLDFWPLGTGWNRWRLIEKIPLVILSLGASAVAIFTQNNRGAAGSLDMFPLHIRLQNALVSYGQYINKTILPRGLSLFYPHPIAVGLSIPAWQWIGAAVVLIAISGIVLLSAKSRPYVLVGWFWFLITSLPIIGLVQVGDQAMADRYSYLPSVGLVIALVWLLSTWAQRNRITQLMGVTAAVAAGLMLVISSVIEIGYWRNTQTIFAHANAVTERNYLARATLAYAMINSPDQQAQALALARSAVQICPARPYPHHILASVLQAQGKYHEAFAEYETALREDPFDAITHSDFGGLLVKMGRDDQAIKQFTVAIQLEPTLAEALHNLAIVLANHNRIDEAIDEWRKAILYMPTDGLIHGWLAVALRVRGDWGEAIKEYRAAFAAGEHNPTWETNFAWLIATDPNATPDELEEAVDAGNKAVKEKRQVMSLDALAAAFARTGRFDDAIKDATEAASDAGRDHQPQLAFDIRQRLGAYRLGHPYLIAKPTSQPIP